MHAEAAAMAEHVTRGAARFDDFIQENLRGAGCDTFRPSFASIRLTAAERRKPKQHIHFSPDQVLPLYHRLPVPG